jgi:hypothetical protein
MPTDYSGHFLIEKRREVEKRIYGERQAAHGFRCLSWL